jgi:putative transposase
LTLVYLDECGFSPSQPVTYSWVLPGERKVVPYENPQGRRVNALAMLVPYGPRPSLTWDEVPRTLTSADLLVMLDGIPRGEEPVVVVLDNAAIHHSKVVHAAVPELAGRGIALYYLPAYSPRLNEIEPYFGVLKQYEMPERTYDTNDALCAAINRGFTALETRLLARCGNSLRQSA